MRLQDAKIAVFTAMAAFFMLVGFAALDLSSAQSDSSEKVGDIIQGFEEDPASEELEDFMQGFDEAPDAQMPAPAQDDIMQGFDEMPAEEKAQVASKKEKQSTWRVKGEFAMTTTYNFSPDAESPWRGFSMLRPELELTLKNKFSDKWQGQISARGFYDAIFQLQGRDAYTPQVLDEYEKELELRDTYIQGSITPQLDRKIGRQIVVWGTLDRLRVNDVLNPLDLRVPGLTDIEDLRLPVTMLKFDYYVGSWNLSAIAIPEVRFSKLPVFGSDFYPLPYPRPPEDKPSDGFQNAQYAAALAGVFSGWDIGFYFANIYSDTAYTELISSEPIETFVRKHARINVMGTAANIASGNWLLKVDTAVVEGIQYSNTPDIEYTRLDLGAGVEYTGFHEAAISLEAVNRHIFDYDSRLEEAPDEIRENEFQWSFRFSKDYLNDTLTLSLQASTFGVAADDGAFERLDAEYAITDAVSIRGGVVLYQAGDKGRFRDLEASDRLFVVLKYNF
jgi:hypothetical protein